MGVQTVDDPPKIAGRYTKDSRLAIVTPGMIWDVVKNAIHLQKLEEC